MSYRNVQVAELFGRVIERATQAPERMNHTAFIKWYWRQPEVKTVRDLWVKQTVWDRVWKSVGVNRPAMGWQTRKTAPEGVKGDDGITRYLEAPRMALGGRGDSVMAVTKVQGRKGRTK